MGGKENGETVEKWEVGGEGEETASTLTCTNAGIIIAIGDHLRFLFTHDMIVVTMQGQEWIIS